MKKNNFTLVELLTVMAILMILAGIMIAASGGVGRQAKEKKTLARMDIIKIALDKYRRDHGYFPVQKVAGDFDPSALGLKSKKNIWLINGYTGTGSYLDAWKQPFQYKFPGSNNGKSYDLWSVGDDNSVGTEDDLTNWEI